MSAAKFAVVFIVGILIGGIVVYGAFPREVVREVPKEVIKTKEVVKEVTKEVPVKPNFVVVYDQAIKIPEGELMRWTNINPGGLYSLELSALILAARYETDAAKRAALYAAVQRLANDELPLIYLYQPHIRLHYWEWVKNFYMNPIAPDFKINWLEKDPSAPRPEQIVYVTIGEPESLDPAVSYESAGWFIAGNVYERLVEYYLDHTDYVIPGLAVAWAVSSDGLNYYFAIRDGVKFYDPYEGKTYDLKPSDVVFSIKRVAGVKESPCWIITDFIDVDAVTVVSDGEMSDVLARGLDVPVKGKSYTVKSLDEWVSIFKKEFPEVPYQKDFQIAGFVKVPMIEPYPALPLLASIVGSIVSEEYVKAHATPADPWATEYLYEHPCGTGAYYVESWEHEAQVVLKPNPYYWGLPKPKIKEFIYKIVPEAQSRILALKAGDADFGYVPAPVEAQMEGVTLEYGGKTWRFIQESRGYDLAQVHLVPNCAKPPFNNKLVRQALAWAIPYNEIIKTVVMGHGDPVYGPIIRGLFGYTEEGITKYDLNLEKAKELLKQAGVDLSKYSIEIAYNEGNKVREQIATILQQTWSQLGFKEVKVTAYAWPTYIDKLETGDFDVGIIGWGADYADPDNFAYPLATGGYKFVGLEVIWLSPAEAVIFKTTKDIIMVAPSGRVIVG